jgi:alginate O-acetyltransferase complex protein AlgJ
VKPTVHPGELSARFAGATSPVQNTSSAGLLEALRAGGVRVFDPAPLLASWRVDTGQPQYLATDTHWRPEAVALVARELAAFLGTHVPLPARPDPGYVTEPHDVTNAGDTALMLDLPGNQQLYPPETATIRRVLAPDGTAWRPSRSADALVLGDSFSNIYSLASMGWGDSAGFIEQLSEALRRPVDRIVQNDDGAYATRLSLRRILAAGEDRLAGTRVVIYQFAARELAVGDWRLIDLPAAAAR